MGFLDWMRLSREEKDVLREQVRTAQLPPAHPPMTAANRSPPPLPLEVVVVTPQGALEGALTSSEGVTPASTVQAPSRAPQGSAKGRR